MVQIGKSNSFYCDLRWSARQRPSKSSSSEQSSQRRRQDHTGFHHDHVGSGFMCEMRTKLTMHKLYGHPLPYTRFHLLLRNRRRPKGRVHWVNASYTLGLDTRLTIFPATRSSKEAVADSSKALPRRCTSLSPTWEHFQTTLWYTTGTSIPPKTSNLPKPSTPPIATWPDFNNSATLTRLPLGRAQSVTRNYGTSSCVWILNLLCTSFLKPYHSYLRINMLSRKATGKTDKNEVMGKLREMKNAM